MERKSATFKLTTKMHTGFGITSFVLGLLSLILMSIAICISAFGNRALLKTQYTIGIFEVIAILMCASGIIYALIGESTRDTYKIFAHLGLILNTIAVFFHTYILIYAY